MAFIKIFLPTAIICFALDMLWLGVVAKSLYASAIGDLMRKTYGAFTPNWVPAILVYLAITIGVVWFAVPKAGGQYHLALVWGALLGMVIYGVYDFTNYSILANWPLNITIIDFIWGMVLCSLTTLFAVFMQNWLTT